MKKSSTHKAKSSRSLEHATTRRVKKVFRDVDVKLGRKRHKR